MGSGDEEMMKDYYPQTLKVIDKPFIDCMFVYVA